MEVKMELSPEVASLGDEIGRVRRELHGIPESGLLEFKTSSFIKGYLTNLGIRWKECAKTGVIAVIDGGGKGDRWTAFRADMDALSVVEETGVEFESRHSGFMHACGHDGHMATMLLLAKLLKSKAGEMGKNVLIIFQPAEEGPGGAKIIMDEGDLDEFDIEAVYGMHLYPEVEEGRFAYRKGPMMAMTGEFDIKIIGKGGHGAMPHRALDSVVIACEMVGKLQSIVSRSVSPIEPAVVTVGRLEAGERRNVIAKDAHLEGTVRAFDKKTFETIRKKIFAYGRGMEMSHDCEVQVDFRTMYSAVVNDANLCDVFEAKNGSTFFIEEIEPQMTAEDFSSYQEKYPGLFVFLGVKSAEKDFVFPLHNSRFNFDEKVLLHGVQAFYNVLR